MAKDKNKKAAKKEVKEKPVKKAKVKKPLSLSAKTRKARNKFNNLNFKFNVFNVFKYSQGRKLSTKNIITTLIVIFVMLNIAVVIGLAASNDFSLYTKFFETIGKTPFQKDNLSYFLSSVATFGTAALAFVFAFKAGLFNIGISGQMLGGAIGAGVIMKFIDSAVGNSGGLIGSNIPNIAGQFAVVFIAIAIGALIATFIGWLKAALNVNEVVSSIMINWIIYFVGIWLVSTLFNNNGTVTDPFSENLLIRDASNNAWPTIIIFAICVILVFIVLRYSTIGRRIISTGLGNSNAKYAGYSVASNRILAMTISGAIAGALGAIVYFGGTNALPASYAAKTIPAEGFNGISVGLIAMCNPIAVVPISVFFAMIDTSRAALSGIGIDGSINDLIFGIVVYGSAIISFFLLMRPWEWMIYLFRGKKYFLAHREYVATMQQHITDVRSAMFNLKTIKQSFKKKHHDEREIVDGNVKHSINLYDHCYGDIKDVVDKLSWYNAKNEILLEFKTQKRIAKEGIKTTIAKIANNEKLKAARALKNQLQNEAVVQGGK